MKQNYREKGDSIFLHGNCGKQPVSTISPEIKSKIVKLKQAIKYDEANFTHFTELLQREENIEVSYSTVTRILKSKNINSPRKQKNQCSS